MKNFGVVCLGTKRRHQLVDVVRSMHHLEEEEFVPPSAIQRRHVGRVRPSMRRHGREFELLSM